MTLACVLFDHDDTLIPTFELRARALDAIAREVLGAPLDAAVFLAGSHGRSLEQMARDLCGDDAAARARLVAGYRQHYRGISRHSLAPYAGIPELLQALRVHGVRVGVVTSKRRDAAREELQRCALAPFIEHLTSADDVVRPKPDAEPLLRALAALEVAASATLMVGDTSADIGGARAARVQAGAALWGARDVQALRGLAPDFVLERPADVLALAVAGDE